MKWSKQLEKVVVIILGWTVLSFPILVDIYANFLGLA